MARWILPSGTTTELDNELRSDAMGPGEIAYNTSVNQVQVATRDARSGELSWQSLTFGSVTLTGEGLEAGQLVVTNNSNEIASLDIGDNEVISSNSIDNLVSTKIRTVHIDDNQVTFSKLPSVPAGNLLGVPVGDLDTEIKTIAIEDIQGAQITASATAPANPEENELWFYCSPQAAASVDGVEPPSSRLYIYLDGSWIDASPPIVSRGEVGPQGLPGTDGAVGAAGRGIGRITSTGMSGGDIILSIFDSATPEALINTVTIARNDIAPVSFVKTTGAATVESGRANYDLSRFIFSDNIPTVISPNHVLIYRGLVLIEDVDYTVAPSGNTITLTPESIAEVASGVLYLTNTTDGGTGVVIGKQTGTVQVESTTATYSLSDFTGITLTMIADDHTLVFEGLVLIEGVDYTVADDSITLEQTTLNEIGDLEMADSSRTLNMYLINITS